RLSGKAGPERDRRSPAAGPSTNPCAHRNCRMAWTIIVAPPRMTMPSRMAVCMWTGSRSTNQRAAKAPGRAAKPISNPKAMTWAVIKPDAQYTPIRVTPVIAEMMASVAITAAPGDAEDDAVGSDHGGAGHAGRHQQRHQDDAGTRRRAGEEAEDHRAAGKAALLQLDMALAR